jgi:hypothetical protein
MKQTIRFLGDTKIFIYTLLWLMVLVVIGTVVQKEIGLYAAQQKYFSAWFTSFGYIPLPGGRLTMLVMFINLTASFLDTNLWKWRKAGILITHFGALLLLVGGGLTAIFSVEGNMIINEGGKSNYFENSYRKELVIIQKTGMHNSVSALSEDFIKSKKRHNFTKPNYSITIIEYYNNINLVEKKIQSKGNYKGLAQHYSMVELPNEAEIERNIPGVIYQIHGTGNDIDGIYIASTMINKSESLQIGNNLFEISLRKERIYLPFELELINFEKIVYPGTGMAKSYSSEVYLIENDINRRVLIEMNEPLRHMGYTFYQSSFRGDSTTILSVVKNQGRLFPYISSIIMSIGLLIHMLIKLPKLMRKKEKLS